MPPPLPPSDAVPQQPLIAVRVRPLVGAEAEKPGTAIPGTTASSFAQFDYEAVVADEGAAKIHTLSEARGLGNQATGGLAARTFAAHAVYGPATTTAQLFERDLAPLLARCADAQATAIAYGQTGAGKTFTMRELQRLCVERMLRRPQGEAPAEGPGGAPPRGRRAAPLLLRARRRSVCRPAAQHGPKWPAWWRRGWPPRAPLTASEGSRLPSALGRRGPAPQLPQRSLWLRRAQDADISLFGQCRLHDGAPLALRDDGSGGIVVDGLREAAASSVAQAMEEAQGVAAVGPVLEWIVSQIEAEGLVAQVKRANEERAGLQQRLAELVGKITVLPGFYQQRIFLGDSAPDLFEVLTQEADGQSSSGFWG